MYVREYSELPGLQRAGRVRYALDGGSGVFQFRITRQPEGKNAVFHLAGVSERAAQDFLCFLYENSVSPEQAFAVAQDSMEMPAVVFADDPAGRQDKF